MPAYDFNSPIGNLIEERICLISLNKENTLLNEEEYDEDNKIDDNGKSGDNSKCKCIIM